MEALFFAAGIPVGIGTSLLSWWILWRVLAPSGRFCPLLSEAPNLARPGEVRYRAKFVSTGRRPMMDVTFSAVLFLPDIESDGGQALMRIPLFDATTPRIGGRRSSGERRNVLDAPHRVLTLLPRDIPPAQLARLAPPVRARLDSAAPGSLTAVLRHYPGAMIVLACTASDSWTGARRSFISAPYTETDVKEGVFRRGPTFEMT